MMARRLVIAGLCLAVLIAAVAIVLDQMAKPGSTSAQGPSSSSSSPGTGSTGAATPTPGSTPSGVANGGTEGSGSGAGGTGSGGADGNASAPTSKPLEVLPPVIATPTGLPEPTTPEPLITGALPAPGSADGELVDGWPDGVLSLPSGTTIGSTSVSTSGNILQLTADGIIAKPRAEVLDSFRQSLVSHGFWSEEAPAADGAVAARFVRGTDTVTVSVSTTGTGSSRFQLLGSLHTTAE
ncbi:hypothetical protein LN996_20555 [Arthrobacter sp. AK01]|uniref:hypothetical protein n=1 Tax=Arthrobacter sp. AK01 TaxID=2894084 RepID=UPI001E3AD2B7|nr:hypothetical protein [Arthrobacter sp. AK01]MCD4853217.1 hypothetical protein [Arthrobacter sp. AK01]